MSDFNLSGLKTWFTDDKNILETIAQQRRDETPAEALPIMVGVFAVGMALGTMGAMFFADKSGEARREEVVSKAKRVKQAGREALS